MLEQDQRDALESVIARANQPIDVNKLELFVGDRALERTFSSPLEVGQWIADLALRHETPELFIHIVDLLDNGDGRLQSLVDLAAALTADPSQWVSAAPVPGAPDWRMDGDPLRVGDGRPFLDREPFRELLPRLNHPDVTPTCILVRGQSGYGKSYLHQYVRRLVDAWATTSGNQLPLQSMLRVGITEFRESQPSLPIDVPAMELAAGLVVVRPTPLPHEDEERHAKDLAEWIARGTTTSALPALAIVDGYGHRKVPEPIRVFIEELVRLVQDDRDVARNLRVVLLGYDPGRLERVGLAFEAIDVNPVSSEDVEAWFRKSFPGRPEHEYRDTVAGIEQRMGASPEARNMYQLCTYVHAASNAFEAH